jgi:hypothetical protein
MKKYEVLYRFEGETNGRMLRKVNSLDGALEIINGFIYCRGSEGVVFEIREAA